MTSARCCLAFWEANTFTPRCGGAVTNAAIVAARCGATVALGGAVGDDQWGHWLEQRLREEQVDLRWWSRLRGQETAVSFVVNDERAQPEFLVYGRGAESAMKSLWLGIDEAVESSTAIMLGSNTLVGESERELSRRTQTLALSAGKPILFDVNLRLNRWRSPRAATNVVRRFYEGALLVSVNGDEARLLTGEDDPATAAEMICSSLGARIAVVTLGADGAVMRGEATTEANGTAASVVDTSGAGDALTGVLVAALAVAGFAPEAAAQALPLAVEIAARATEGFGATDSIPRSISLPR
ncbi:MAG: PfkB family carbohydrate kinase [Gaiellaceae bacterium]|jgi:fructokinase